MTPDAKKWIELKTSIVKISILDRVNNTLALHIPAAELSD